MPIRPLNDTPKRRRRATPDPEPVVEQSCLDNAPGLPANWSELPFRTRYEILTRLDKEAAERMALDTMSQYIMARTPVETVAQRMGYSIPWVVSVRDRVRTRWREEAKTFDTRTYLMSMLDQYKEIAAGGFREASAAKAGEYQRRLKGFDTARGALRDQVNLLQLAGAFDAAPLRDAIEIDDDGENSSAAILKNLATSFLSGGYDRKSIPHGTTIIDDGSE